MADVLSQTEVEALLAALDPESNSTALPNLVNSTAATGRQGLASSQISVYDFKRPERVSKEQMRAFQALHEGFSREFGAALSSMLRTIIEVKLISVDQLTYSEFVFSLENPTCFNLLQSRGEASGHIILELNPAIIFPIVDRLLGGGREGSGSLPTRPLTEIELRIISRITDLAVRGLEGAWSKIVQWNLHVTQVESNPQLVQIVPPNEVVVLVSFEIAMGDSRGILNLCIPFNTIEPLSSKLTSDTWTAYTRRKADPLQKLSLESNLAQARVELRVNLAKTKLTAGDLTRLAVGDVIMTETSTDRGLEVVIEGRPTFLAHPGVLKGRMAARIERVLSRPKDLLAKKMQELGHTFDDASAKKS